jgi:hypothetical protein
MDGGIILSHKELRVAVRLALRELRKSQPDDACRARLIQLIDQVLNEGKSAAMAARIRGVPEKTQVSTLRHAG